MESKGRLEKMAEEKAIYEETLVQERKNIYEKKLKEFEVRSFKGNWYCTPITFISSMKPVFQYTQTICVLRV